jgi:hypothetical protein
VEQVDEALRALKPCTRLVAAFHETFGESTENAWQDRANATRNDASSFLDHATGVRVEASLIRGTAQMPRPDSPPAVER